MNTKRLHTPVPIITHNGGLIIAAAKDHSEIATRLTAAAIAAADALCQKLSGDVTTQKGAKGELGNLTAAQTQNLNTLHQCMAAAAKTAKLAFFGQTVKLHAEFQTGAHDANDLGSYLGRVDIVLGSVNNAANLAALKLKGWTDAETTAFQSARDAFGPAEQYRVKIHQRRDRHHHAKERRRRHALRKHSDHSKRRRFAMARQRPGQRRRARRISARIFPPDHGGNHTPPPTPPTTTPNPPVA